jgi:hypothetical protein
MAGAVPDLASGSVGSAQHLWVGRVAFGWLLWVAWQTGLLYNSNDMRVSGRGGSCMCDDAQQTMLWVSNHSCCFCIG